MNQNQPPKAANWLLRHFGSSLNRPQHKEGSSVGPSRNRVCYCRLLAALWKTAWISAVVWTTP
jgi:hypothetical protein